MKNQRLSRIFLVCLLTQGLFVSGCATHGARMVKQSEQQVSEQNVVAQVATQLEALEARMSEAQANDVTRFAPYDMKDATSALNSARRYYEDFRLEPQNVNKSVSLFFGETMGQKTLGLISKANAALGRAEENKRQADIILSESNENFVWLKKVNAQVNFPYAYRELERSQKTMIDMVARGNLDRARARLPQMLKEQRALEIVAAQHFHLDTLSQRIEREGRYELNRYANLSYSASVNALNKAKVVVAQDPRNEAAILEAKQQTEFAFDVAGAVAKDMKRLVNMDREEMERWLIMVTTKLGKAGVALGANDIRNQSLLDQVELIAEAARSQEATPVQTAPAQAVSAELVAETAAPAEAKAAETPATEAASAAPTADAGLVNRVSKLEQTLSQQIQALSDQMKKMQALNQSAAVAMPSKETNVPLRKRRSLFVY